MLEEYEQPLDAFDRGAHVVCDRWHLGELVYGPLLRGGARLTPVERFHIELYLHSRGGFIVHVNTPLPIIRDRFAARGDDLVQHDQLPQIIATYADVIKESRCPTLVVPDSSGRAVSDIIEFGSVIQNTVEGLKPFETYIGGPFPRVLLLGETRGNPGKFRAAFPPAQYTSGKYLLEALIGQREWRVGELGIANAMDEDVFELWDALQRPVVVTLGKKAMQICSAAHVPHAIEVHPQFVRRFHHKTKDEYGRRIIEKAGIS